jgi:transaldolase
MRAHDQQSGAQALHSSQHHGIHIARRQAHVHLKARLPQVLSSLLQCHLVGQRVLTCPYQVAAQAPQHGVITDTRQQSSCILTITQGQHERRRRHELLTGHHQH